MIQFPCAPRNRVFGKIFSSVLAALLLFSIRPLLAQGSPVPVESGGATTWAVSIVLPSRMIAGMPATLAVLGVDGRLASGVAVEAGTERVTTDLTGRANFTAPSSGQVFLAKASGASSAALIDPAPPAGVQQAVSVAPVASIGEPLSICGWGFRGDAEATHVRINGEPALVLGASPECLSVLPSLKTPPGPAQISIVSAVTPGGRWTANTTFVALDSEPPLSKVTPGQKTSMNVRVRGSEQRLRIVVENQTPGVLRFSRGDVQELITTGGRENIAQFDAQTIRSGDFSFDARLMGAPDQATARAYLQAAVPLATQERQRAINRLVKELARPRNFEEIRRDIDGILNETIAGDFRTVLTAARLALS